MNKAFTRENDEAPDDDPVLPEAASGPEHVTAAGFRRMQDELYDLKHRERPEVTRVVAWAAGNGDRSENGDYIYGKKRLREIDRRLAYLSRRLRVLRPVTPDEAARGGPPGVVRFGATVETEDRGGDVRVYAIVGVDEVDAARGLVSFRSPLGAALLGKEEGDVVTFTAPGGTRELEIVSVSYGPVGPG